MWISPGASVEVTHIRRNSLMPQHFLAASVKIWVEFFPKPSTATAVASVGNGTVLNAVVLLPVHIPEVGVRRDVQTLIEIPCIPGVTTLLQRLVLVVFHPLRVVTFADTLVFVVSGMIRDRLDSSNETHLLRARPIEPVWDERAGICLCWSLGWTGCRRATTFSMTRMRECQTKRLNRSNNRHLPRRRIGDGCFGRL